MSIGKFSIEISCVLVLLLRATAYGQGGPPLIGDDPGTPGDGHWEINVFYPYERTSRQITMETPHLDLNYGLGDHIQLKYETGWLLGKEDDQPWQSGVNDSLAGVKWRFRDQDKSGFDMSIYPQLGFNTTPALSRAGLVDSGVSFFMPVEIAKTIGKLELDAEAGYQYIQHARDEWAAGTIIGYELTDRIELIGEARGVFDQTGRRNDLIIDAGTRVSLSDHVALFFAAGRSVRSTDDSPSLLVTAGIRVTF